MQPEEVRNTEHMRQLRQLNALEGMPSPQEQWVILDELDLTEEWEVVDPMPIQDWVQEDRQT